jgi:small neutral amino acid transporter SnatA (MarC family)
VLVATIGLAYAGIFVLLRFVSEHSHRLGDTPIKVSSRLMGLILVAVSVQFVLEGIRTADLF